MDSLNHLPIGVDEQIRIHIRWMTAPDMEEVLLIERECFPYPWAKEDFLTCLRTQNCIGMVMEAPPYDRSCATSRGANYLGHVAGFAIYGLRKRYVEILNLAVSLNYRRKGVGSQMVSTLIDKLSYNGRNKIVLQVRETNLIAQLFFRALNFRAVRILPAYYEDSAIAGNPGEDAYTMEHTLNGQQF